MKNFKCQKRKKKSVSSIFGSVTPNVIFFGTCKSLAVRAFRSGELIEKAVKVLIYIREIEAEWGEVARAAFY